MPLTISIVRRTYFGNRRAVIADLTFDNSYPTGGESLVANDLGMRSIDMLMHNSTVGGFPVDYDYTNNTFLVRQLVANHNHASTGLTVSTHTAHAHNLHLNDGEIIDDPGGAGTRVNAGGNLLGANTGADILITGVADTTGHGGIVQTAQAVHALGASTSATATAPAGNSETAATELANTSNVLDGLAIRVMAIGI